MGILHVATILVVLAGTFANDPLQEARVCHVLVDTCQHDFTSILRSLEETPDIGQACTILSQVRTCMGDCIQAFTGSGSASRAALRVLDYICDSERREQITTVSQLQCFQDETFHESFEQEAQNCVANTGRRVQQVMRRYSGLAAYAALCNVVREAVTCVSGKAADMCGEEVRPFIEDILEIAITEMTEGQLPNCFQQVTNSHSAIRRSVRFMKLFKKK